VKIINFSAIHSEFGRETADRALVVAASLLRHAIADIDLAARVGDHEFALLLEGPTTADIAMSRAQHVIASGLRSSNALPATVTLKFYVCVAMLPEGDLGAEASLQAVTEGVRTVPVDVRKMIRPLNF
jgi:two-component system, sensor histidine kinase LadS